MINPVDAVSALLDAATALAKIEGVIKSIDPEFKAPQPAHIKTTLGGLVVTAEHQSKALEVGQNIDTLLMLARRQLAEAATTIRNITLTMPESDKNSAAIQSVIETLTK